MGDRRGVWTISDPFGGPSIRVKRFHEVAPDEPFQESFGRVGDKADSPVRGVLYLLARPGNEQVAREIYADVTKHPALGQPDEPLDQDALDVIQAQFEKGHYVIVPLVPKRIEHFDWTTVPFAKRNAYVMKLLIDDYGFPSKGAAGIVGNLDAESGLLPNRLEGSYWKTPQNSLNFGKDTPKHEATRGQFTDFSPEEIRDRNWSGRTGPYLPGIGIAQWTSDGRRQHLFEQEWNGKKLGTSILENMDAQVGYLVNELKANYPDVNATCRNPNVSVEDACDSFHYRFEAPGALFDHGRKRALTENPVVGKDKKGKPITVNVGELVEGRRQRARTALQDYLKSEQDDS